MTAIKADVIELLEAYKKKGFVVHPLTKPDDKGTSPGKKPLLSKWEQLTETPGDIEIFIKDGYNIGLVCGKASGITVIDLDRFLFIGDVFCGSEFDTLRSRRTDGRGHVYFLYNLALKPSKHHLLGIEILSDGNNVVVPPSVHTSGDLYRWNDINKPIVPMPEIVEKNLLKLFDTESELKQLIGKCRTCFRKILKDYPLNVPDMHGSDGREYMLALCTDLKAQGATDEHIKMFSRLLYVDKYDEARTLKEWNNIDASKTWQCDTLRAKLPSYVYSDECSRCAASSSSFSTSPPSTPIPAQIPSSSVGSPLREMDLQDIQKLNISEHERRLKLDLPADHFVSRCVTWLNSINDGYYEYKVMSSLWILSALASNKLILKLKQGDIKPNLWICMLGRSTTSRKSTVVNACRNVYEVSTDSVLYNDDYSIEGYLETLGEHSVLHNVRDEVAGLMAKFHKKYNEGIFELECNIYDCHNIKKTLGSGGKNKGPKVYEVYNPYVTKLYATTPDNFARYMTVEDFTCGYGYRFLFMNPRYLRPKMPLEMQTEEDIEAWSNVLGSVKRMARYFSEMTEIPFGVDNKAMDYYNTILTMLEEKADSSNNDHMGAAIGRNQGHILKIAMLLEIGKSDPSHIITYDSMVIACRMVVDYFLPEMLDMIERLQDDVKMYQVEKVATTLNRKGGLMSHSKLLHDCKLKSKEFAECIATLIEGKGIEAVRDKNTKIVYYRSLNHSNSKILSTLVIPAIPPVLLFPHGSINEENLENSNKLHKSEKKPDTRDSTRARAPAASPAIKIDSVRERENEGNSVNWGELKKNTQYTPTKSLAASVFSSYSPSPNTPISTGTYISTGTCFFCSHPLSTHHNSNINFGLGLGEVHESCLRAYEKALTNLKKKYSGYTPNDAQDLSRRLTGIHDSLSELLEDFTDDGIKFIIDIYCKERSWSQK